MEIGDLIYIILLLLFMILGFFNDSRKKKEQQNQQQKPNPKPDFQPEDREITQSPPPFLTEDQVKRFEFQKERRVKQGDSKNVFQSSMDLTTDFKKESSLGSSIFRNEADSLYEQVADIPGLYDSDSEMEVIQESTGETKYGTHPIVEDLIGVNRTEELKKGLIYSEILKKKY
jgi:hypothetical protein